MAQLDLLSAIGDKTTGSDAISVVGMMLLDGDVEGGGICMLVSCADGRYLRVSISEDFHSMEVMELIPHCSSGSVFALPCCEHMYLLSLVASEQPLRLLGLHSHFGIQSFSLDTLINADHSSLTLKGGVIVWYFVIFNYEKFFFF
jgi:hypothetical protein